MKCRYCEKPIKNTKSDQKKLGLCTKCYNWDKKSFAEGFKYNGLLKAK